MKGFEGYISFDSDSDGSEEMRLNQTGLGVGISPSANLHVNGNMLVTEKLNIGGASGSANFNMQGNFEFQFQSVSSDTTLSNSSLVLVDSSADNIILTLPYAGNVLGRVYQIKKTDTNNHVVIRGNYIDSAASYLLNSGSMGYLKLISSGNDEWSILDASSDAGNWTPAALNTILWLDASDSSAVTISNGNVTQWSDKSLQGNHAIQNSENLHPTYDATGFNNLPSISFDGIDDGFNLSSDISIPYDIFGVESGHGYFMSNTGASQRLIPRYSGTGGFYWNPSPGLTDIATTTWRDNTSIQQAYYSLDAAANYILGINGEDELMGTGAVSTNDINSIGLQWGAATGVPTWTGDMAEILVFGTTLSTADRERVEGYLAWKWDLVDELDVSHSYKTNRP